MLTSSQPIHRFNKTSIVTNSRLEIFKCNLNKVVFILLIYYTFDSWRI